MLPVYRYPLVIGIRRSLPNARCVILMPSDACLRLYSLRSTITMTRATVSRSNPMATMSSRARSSMISIEQDKTKPTFRSLWCKGHGVNRSKYTVGCTRKKSDWAYYGSGRAIRVGFMQLKALREDVVKQIVSERQTHGAYRSLQDFIGRVNPEVAQAVLLIKSGCFDTISGELTRPALIWRLFAARSDKPVRYLPIPPEYSTQQKLAHELELFGFSLHGHPLDLFTDRVTGQSHLPARDLAQHIRQDVTLLGWMVTEKVVSTKKGEPMEFVTFEDQTSLYDATFFPDTYRRYCHLLSSNQAYLVTGRVEAQFATVTVTVTRLRLLSAPAVEDSLPLEKNGSEPYTESHDPLSPSQIRHLDLDV